MSGLQRAGVSIVTLIFSIISGVIAALFVSIWITEIHIAPEINALNQIALSAAKQYDAASSPATFQAATESAKRLGDAQKELRAFWLSFGQFLLGFLLPVLTSILGYLFGTSQADKSRS
jgi:hypothetical protein